MLLWRILANPLAIALRAIPGTGEEQCRIWHRLGVAGRRPWGWCYLS